MCSAPVQVKLQVSLQQITCRGEESGWLPANTLLVYIAHLAAGLRIRIHLIRIRISIQHFRLNTDPDPDHPDPKLHLEKKIKFFGDQKLQFTYP
jgi:hypothetical protein